MRHEIDSFRFEKARHGVAQIAPPGTIPLFEDMPAGIELEHAWYRRKFDVADVLDREALVTNPAAPAVGTGTHWTSTTISNASTMTFTLSGFPSFLRIATSAAADGSGTSFQQNVGGQTMFDFQSSSTLRKAYYSIMMRVSDITQSEFFVGFAPTDTSPIAGLDDFVGIAKDDGSTVVRLVASGSSVALQSAGTSEALCDLSVYDAFGGSAASDWLIYTLMVERSTVYGFVQNERELSPGRIGSCHLGQITLPTFGSACCPTFVVATGEAVAKNFDIAYIDVAGKYELGGRTR